MGSRRKLLFTLLAATTLLILVSGMIGWWWLHRFEITEIQGQPLKNAWPAYLPDPQDWPCWRGPHLNGEASGAALPVQWSASRNIKWKKPLNGRGHASPIVVGNQVYLYTAEEPSQQLSLYAYDRQNGDERWSIQLHQGGFPVKHQKNSFASSTPACDGKHVYTVAAVNDGITVSATTTEGKLAWQTPTGPFLSEMGYSASPLLWNSYIIVIADSSPSRLRRISTSPSFIAALDRKTGQIIWRIRRPMGHSYGTPTIANIAGKEQLIAAGPDAIISYNPSSGEEYWRHQCTCTRTANTVATQGDRLLVTLTIPSRLSLCISGKDGSLLWKSERHTCDVPTPMFRGEQLYLFEDNGIVTCLKTDNGEPAWRGRLGSGNNISASPVSHGKTIYVATEGGKTYVLEDGPAFKLLSTNDLGEEQMATPAIAGGDIFIRTSQHLWCISTTPGKDNP